MNIRLRLVSEYFVEPGRGFGSVDDSTISVAFINTGAEFFSQCRSLVPSHPIQSRWKPIDVYVSPSSYFSCNNDVE